MPKNIFNAMTKHVSMKSLLLIGFLLLVLIVGIVYVKRPQELRQQAGFAGANLSMSPANFTPPAGQPEFKAGIILNSGINHVTAAEIHLVYDPALVQITAFEPGKPLPVILSGAIFGGGNFSVTLGAQPNVYLQGSDIIGTITVKVLTSNPAWVSFGENVITAIESKGNIFNTATGISINGGTSTPPYPPAGCYYQQVECFQGPCYPILVCPQATCSGPNGSACSVSKCYGPLPYTNGETFAIGKRTSCSNLPGTCQNSQCIINYPPNAISCNYTTNPPKLCPVGYSCRYSEVPRPYVHAFSTGGGTNVGISETASVDTSTTNYWRGRDGRCVPDYPSCGPEGSYCAINYCPPMPVCKAGMVCPQVMPACTSQAGSCRSGQCIPTTPTPTPITRCSTDNDCPIGNYCSAVPPGGCPSTTVNGLTSTSTCSGPYPRCWPRPTPTCVPKPPCVDGIMDPRTGVKTYCDPRPGTIFCPPTPPPNPQLLTFKIMLAGVTSAGPVDAGATLTAKFYLSNGTVVPIGNPLTKIPLTYDGNGIYKAATNLANPFPNGTKFAVQVTVDKHLGLRFCQQTGQTNPCDYSTWMTVNDYNFDFTGRPLPAGDLDNNGRVEATTDMKIFTDLWRKPPSQLTIDEIKSADVNYNGTLDQMDFFEILKTLSVRYNE